MEYTVTQSGYVVRAGSRVVATCSNEEDARMVAEAIQLPAELFNLAEQIDQRLNPDIRRSISRERETELQQIGLSFQAGADGLPLAEWWSNAQKRAWRGGYLLRESETVSARGADHGGS